MSEAEENNDNTPLAETGAAPRFGLDTVIADAKSVITQPVAFFRGMAVQGGFAEPAIFVAVMGAVAGLLIAVLALIGFGAVGAAVAGFAAIFIMPIFAVIGSFIGAAVMFVLWKLMGSERDFEASYRCVAFASALYPVNAFLGLVPYLGTIVSVLWGIYLMYCATTWVHKIDAGKAKVVLGIIAAVLLFFQLSTEIATRNLQATVETHTQEMNESMEDFGKAMEQLGSSMEGIDTQEMTPEEAGKAVGDFFRGMNEAMQKAQAEAEANAEASAEAVESTAGGSAKE